MSGRLWPGGCLAAGEGSYPLAVAVAEALEAGMAGG